MKFSIVRTNPTYQSLILLLNTITGYELVSEIGALLYLWANMYFRRCVFFLCFAFLLNCWVVAEVEKRADVKILSRRSSLLSLQKVWPTQANREPMQAEKARPPSI